MNEGKGAGRKEGQKREIKEGRKMGSGKARREGWRKRGMERDVTVEHFPLSWSGVTPISSMTLARSLELMPQLWGTLRSQRLWTLIPHAAQGRERERERGGGGGGGGRGGRGGKW